MRGFIHSVESLGTVDGPGIRFVIFFQGCPMRCLYCHNPDTWEGQGSSVTAEHLLELFERNRPFYKDGGITATGGEPMLQLPFLTELFTKAKERDIHTCLDTSGICFRPEDTAETDALLDVTDLVMLDIKHIDPERHRALTGHGNENILAFAEHISERNVPLWIRHVVVPGWTDEAKAQERLGYFIGSLKTLKALDCLPYHDMGKHKYEKLGLPYTLEGVPPTSQEQAAAAKEAILRGIKRRLRESGA